MSGGSRDILEVARFSTIPEAELAAAFLQRQGLKAWLPDRDMATVNPDMLIAIGGVRVVTHSEEVAEARRLIAEMRAGNFVEDDEETGDWMIDHTPGRVGELEDHEIRGVMGPAKKAGIIIVVLFFVVFPLTGCVMMALGA